MDSDQDGSHWTISGLSLDVDRMFIGCGSDGFSLDRDSGLSKGLGLLVFHQDGSLWTVDLLLVFSLDLEFFFFLRIRMGFIFLTDLDGFILDGGWFLVFHRIWSVSQGTGYIY
jgi:hypothetical protein